MEKTGGIVVVNTNLAYKLNGNDVTNIKVADAPLKWCSVSLSDVISRGKRLEASVFDIEAKQARDIIMNGKYPCVPLFGENGLIEKAYYPGRFKRVYCEKGNGEAFFLPSQMTDIYPKAEKYISRLTKCDISELRLKQNTLLLTRSGTIGTISLVSKTTEGKVFSDDVIRVTFKNTIDLGYCYTFLKSKLGNIVLQTNGYGSVITHLEPEHLCETHIPNAPTEIKSKIHNLILKSFILRDESNDLIDEATAMLTNELNLPNIEDLKVDYYKKGVSINTFNVKLSNINGRVDASYHVPVVSAINEYLSKYAEKVTTIGDKGISSDIVLPGRFKRVYVDEGYGITFFSGKNISELNPSDKRYLSFSQHDKKIKDELLIKEGMLLVTCSGTIGKCVLVPKHWNEWAMTHDIIRLILKEEVNGYCYIWLNSEYGKTILQSYQYGSVVQHIEKEHISKMPIPLLKNKNIQNKINTLALKANEKRYEAYLLEQEALKIMDDEVIFAK